jgi:hypothetical protein
MEGRAYGLERVQEIQAAAGVDLVNDEEEARIREMWALDMWPRKWSADDAAADEPLPVALTVTRDGRLVEQDVMLALYR